MKEETPQQIAHYLALFFTALAGIAGLPAYLIFTSGVWPWVYFLSTTI